MAIVLVLCLLTIQIHILQQTSHLHQYFDTFYYLLDFQIVVSILDLMDAGTITAATTIRWGILYLVTHPEWQDRAQREIDDTIGRSKFPENNDIPTLPFVNALVHEIHRYSSVASMGGPHMASHDVKIGGFTIPRGATVIPYIKSVHFDKSYYKYPDAFNPENFLNAEGQFQMVEAFVPFSKGESLNTSYLTTNMV